MQEPSTVNQKLDSIRLIKLLIKWRKHLIVTAVISGIVSFIFTLPQFMTPMFKATSVIYPVSLKSYSKESPTEQMVQYLNSVEVLEKLVVPFDLYNHYGVDSVGRFPRFEMLNRINENVKVAKTEFESIEINIWDKDPFIAAKMCDSLIRYADEKALTILRDSCKEVLVIIKGQLDEKKSEMDSLENAIKILRMEYGITDFENQVEGFSREYYHSLSSGNVNTRMETTQRNLQEKGGEYILLKELLWRVRGNYYETKLRYDLVLSDIRKIKSFHSVVTKATPPEKKDYPKRSLIMVLFMLSMLFVAVLIIIYQEHYKQIFQRELGDARSK